MSTWEPLATSTAAEFDEVMQQMTGVDLGPGRLARVLDRRPSEFATSYAIDIVTVSLSSGATLELFLKDYGISRHGKQEEEDRHDRECLVYRDLLAGARLGTPEFHGSGRHRSTGRRWLLLEHVDGTRLLYRGFDEWVDAAAWLGRLHGRFAAELPVLVELDYLRRYDADYYHATADAADRTVAEISARLRRRLVPVLARFRAVIPRLAGEPQTLVHGNYSAINILIAEHLGRQRIAPVDWEAAGVGSPTYDLAYLVYGFSGAQLTALLEAHRTGAAQQGFDVPGTDEARVLLDCFIVYKNLATLRKAIDRGFEHRAEHLVEVIESLGSRLP